MKSEIIRAVIKPPATEVILRLTPSEFHDLHATVEARCAEYAHSNGTQFLKAFQQISEDIRK